MRINIYAEELPEKGSRLPMERVSKKTDSGRTFFGARLYLQSAEALHDTPDDDDRSAVTIWGPRAQVAQLLRELADTMEGNQRAR